jgi:hypothetical protein
MANTVIQLKYSATPSAVPASLANGELAINYADGKLFYRNVAGYIVGFSSGANVYNFSTINANGSIITASGANSILSLSPGENISITGDIFNDVVTISANLKPAFDVANAAYNYANTLISGGGASVNVGSSAPPLPNVGNMWWDTTSGRLFIYYTDMDSSQWVEASPSGGSINIASLAANVTPYFSAPFDVANAAYNTANATYNFANGVAVNAAAAFAVSNTAVQNGSSFITIGDSGILSKNTSIGVTTEQILDSFSTNSWRSANYVITMNTSTDYHTTQLTVIHDGTNAYMTEYGLLYTNNILGLFNASIDMVSSSVRLNITPTFTGTSIKVLRTTNK